MCSIAGIYCTNGVIDSKTIIRMNEVLRHRGPDDEGYVLINSKLNESEFFSGDNSTIKIKNDLRNIKSYNETKRHNLAFAHNRLSIIDLSDDAHQPMTDESNNYLLVYNGEIYNYVELFDELSSYGYSFKSKSDTEVLLNSYIHWGTKCLNKLNGMFSFAIWDNSKRTLFCARDRFGIKPFYYYFDGKTFIFASEIKAILENDRLNAEVNKKRLINYLVTGIKVGSNETFYENINSLLPSHYLIIENDNISIREYWSLNSKLHSNLNEKDISERLYEKLIKSVSRHMRSDVPVSFCLSGGLDSTSLVSIASTLGNNSNFINTYSSCFENNDYDERKYIHKFLDLHKGINSNFVFPNPANFISDFENIIWHQEEPFGGFSIYAQWELMKEIHKHKIKVVIDGQGSDEIFGGYNSFIVPNLISMLSNWAFTDFIGDIKMSQKKLGNVSLTKEILLYMIEYYSPGLLYKIIKNRRKKPEWLKDDYSPYLFYVIPDYNDPVQYQTAKELGFLRIPELLHNEDRNSMAFGIESRVPFLDHELVEYVYSLSSKYKYDNNSTKKVLRKLMRNQLPNEIINRKDKMGFVTPGEDLWLKNDLKKWVLEILNSNEIISKSIYSFDISGDSLSKYFENTKGTRVIWKIINTEIWLRRFKLRL